MIICASCVKYWQSQSGLNGLLSQSTLFLHFITNPRTGPAGARTSSTSWRTCVSSRSVFEPSVRWITMVLRLEQLTSIDCCETCRMSFVMGSICVMLLGQCLLHQDEKCCERIANVTWASESPIIRWIEDGGSMRERGNSTVYSCEGKVTLTAVYSELWFVILRASYQPVSELLNLTLRNCQWLQFDNVAGTIWVIWRKQ